MAVKNFPDISPDANPSFTLENNTTSFESTLNKNVQHMELPGARWRGSVAFSNRTRQEANKIKAFMTSLSGQVGRFYLTPFDAYQSGTMSGTGVVDGAVSFGASTIPTKGWEGDQDALFETGDYLEVNGELKMITGDVAAPQSYIEYTGTNYMPSPFDPSGWSGASDNDGVITNVALLNPSGENISGLAEKTSADPGWFQLATSQPVAATAGEKIYISVLVKNFTGFDLSIYLRFGVSGGAYANGGYINIDTGLRVGGGTGMDYRFTDLEGEWKLLEGVHDVLSDDDYVAVISPRSGDGTTFCSVGDKLYVQAAYFGKANDFPAQLLATADIPIAPPLRKPLTGGESITVVNPKGKFYLGSNDQSWDINVNGVQSIGFDFIEDVN